MPVTMGMLAGGIQPPLFVGKGSPAVNTTQSSQPSYNGNTEVGDFHVLICQTDQNDQVNTPSGWTKRVQRSSGECLLWVFTRHHVSGSSVTVSWHGDHILCNVLTFRHVHASNPVNAKSEGASGSTSTAVSIPGLTTTVPQCLVLAIVAHDINSSSAQVSGWSNSSLSDRAELEDICTQVGWDGGFAVYSGYKAAAGNVSATTATLGTGKKKAYACLALRPA